MWDVLHRTGAYVFMFTGVKTRLSSSSAAVLPWSLWPSIQLIFSPRQKGAIGAVREWQFWPKEQNFFFKSPPPSIVFLKSLGNWHTLRWYPCCKNFYFEDWCRYPGGSQLFGLSCFIAEVGCVPHRQLLCCELFFPVTWFSITRILVMSITVLSFM